MASGAKSVLLTGGTGYLANLILAKLLVEEQDISFLIVTRRRIDLAELLRPVEAEMRLKDGILAKHRERIRLVCLPDWRHLRTLDTLVRELRVNEIVHAAGCLDYFDQDALREVNIEFTRALVEWASTWKCKRLIYISSAFSSGYRKGSISEGLHNETVFADPTEYTRSKRCAEQAVASGGVPYLILRPSVVIGDSRDGHYTGKRYGLYQLWMGLERLLFDRWRPVIHVVGPAVVTQFLHQDAFQDIFLGAFRYLPDNSVLHLVSQHGPTLGELWKMWLEETLQPREIVFHERVEDVPLRELDRRQRALLALTSTNLEIAAHEWSFETPCLDGLRSRGVSFADTTHESVHGCQELFIKESRTIQRFLSTAGTEFGKPILTS